MRKHLILWMLPVLAAGLSSPLRAQQAADLAECYLQQQHIDSLQRVQTLEYSGRFLMNGAEYAATARLMGPGNLVLTLRQGRETLQFHLAGGKYWLTTAQSGPNQILPAPPEFAPSMLRMAFPAGFLLNQPPLKGPAQLLGNEVMYGQDVYLLETVTSQKYRFRYVLTAGDCRAIQLESTVSASGQTFAEACLFSDFRDTYGIQLPYRIDAGPGKTPNQIFLIDSYQFNGKLNAKDFRIPEGDVAGAEHVLTLW
ncbi:MAG: hypothetical protein NW241_21475 [Bacteroidia bacterium]|nr:hypothetical protein [Bacteroidia bacterium]